MMIDSKTKTKTKRYVLINPSFALSQPDFCTFVFQLIEIAKMFRKKKPGTQKLTSVG